LKPFFAKCHVAALRMDSFLDIGMNSLRPAMENKLSAQSVLTLMKFFVEVKKKM